MDKEVIKLSTQLKGMKFDRLELETEFKAQGQKIFMKRFLRKLLDFDWSIFVPAIMGYVEDLKRELAKEAQKWKEEVAEKPFEIAKKNNQVEAMRTQADLVATQEDVEKTNPEA